MSNPYSPAPGTPQTPAKAVAAVIVACVTAALTVLLVVLSADSEGGSSITGVEWVTLALAVVGVPALTGGAVYSTKNKSTV